MKYVKFVKGLKVFILLSLSYNGTSLAGSSTLGEPINGLLPSELQSFQRGLKTFQEIDSVTGTEPGATGVGLGPRFNNNSCASCHANPNVGGSSPSSNPQVHLATQFGANNKVPFFININGPVREARFRYNADGTRDGGVHDIYVISGRADAGKCNIAQPDFDSAAKKNNLIFRIPTPLFGAGLIEQIQDSTILANKAADPMIKTALGITGHENRSGNDGTITRFGWKAQNKSLTIFAGEAYNVEQGVTNELFQTERDETPQCLFNGTPEDHSNMQASTALDSLSDVAAFTLFMRFLAPPPPVVIGNAEVATRGPASVRTGEMPTSIRSGANLFVTIGCAQCHTPALTTGVSSTTALSNVTANLYSDLLVHHMGPNLADDIIQGNAGPDEFRTAPLWGLGQRLFFLHDGRTQNLTEAIRTHASGSQVCTAGQVLAKGNFCASEANQVIKNFNSLSEAQQQALVGFLKAL